VFWDTEAFVLPVLEYRIRRLGPARRRAGVLGRTGARFPRESALTGEDVIPTTGIDRNGETVAIGNGDLEEHITAIVAWSAWHYASWHVGWAFLEGPGRPLLVDTARYWASRLRWDAGGHAHIDRVAGPDEYHEDVDDNTFTNRLARWNLERGAEVLERTAPDTGEASEWRGAAQALVDNYDPATRRYEQFAGYDGLEPFVAADVGTPPIAADFFLESARLGGSQVIKQADVLMGHFLIPDGMAEGSLVPNLDHYLPQTVRGSSFSPAVHAALLAPSGRTDEALSLFRLAAAINLDDLTGTTADGLHLAHFGGLWQAVVHGLLGLSVPRPGDMTLVLAPHLPDGWEEIRFRSRWRRTRVALVCRNDAVHVACDRPLAVEIHGVPETVRPPGGWVG